MTNSFYDLGNMLKEKKVRKGDILEVRMKEDDSFLDYYLVTEKDIVELLPEDTDRKVSIFDNFWFFDIMNKLTFNVIYKAELKTKIFDKLKTKGGEKN